MTGWWTKGGGGTCQSGFQSDHFKLLKVKHFFIEKGHILDAITSCCQTPLRRTDLGAITSPKVYAGKGKRPVVCTLRHEKK